MGRQWNTIIESLGPLTGGSMSISANLTDIEALLTTLQADIVDGIIVSSGTVQSNLRDGSGNLITSTTSGTNRRLDVMLSSAGTTGSAVPNTANLYAGTDGTNLRAISTDTTGRVNVNQTYGTTTIGTLTAGVTNGTLFASNTNRKYLLVQCTSGTAFIDTNGTATTADGIQLTSGQGITFEGSFVPTGAIAAITSTGTARLIGRQG
jgi:hypothetical protein